MPFRFVFVRVVSFVYTRPQLLSHHRPLSIRHFAGGQPRARCVGDLLAFAVVSRSVLDVCSATPDAAECQIAAAIRKRGKTCRWAFSDVVVPFLSGRPRVRRQMMTNEGTMTRGPAPPTRGCPTHPLAPYAAPRGRPHPPLEDGMGPTDTCLTWRQLSLKASHQGALEPSPEAACSGGATTETARQRGVSTCWHGGHRM